MDALIAPARAAGDALGVLKRVSLRDDPPALALRGTAMARLGELARARELLGQAARLRPAPPPGAGALRSESRRAVRDRAAVPQGVPERCAARKRDDPLHATQRTTLRKWMCRSYWSSTSCSSSSRPQPITS